MKLSPEEFVLLRDYICERTGLFLKDRKKDFLETRLETRFNKLGCADAQEYYRILRTHAAGGEFGELIETLTTNETCFFRDKKQLDAFVMEAVPLVMERKRERGETCLRIWSAGCSTGEEAYTLAMLVREAGVKGDVSIVGTDINTRVLDKARRGVYSGRTLRYVPEEYLQKYFVMTDSGYEVIRDLKNMIEFKSCNLASPSSMALIGTMDVIFCRNVLIYFSRAIAKRIVRSFYGSLSPGGYVFLGVAESMNLLGETFEQVRFRELFGYRKA